MNLLDHLANDQRSGVPVYGLTATVVSAGSGTATIEVHGSSISGVPVAGSCPALSANDVVLVIRLGDSWLVLTTL